MKNKISTFYFISESTSKIINEKLKEFSQDKDFNKILNAINAQ